MNPNFGFPIYLVTIVLVGLAFLAFAFRASARHARRQATARARRQGPFFGWVCAAGGLALLAVLGYGTLSEIRGDERETSRAEPIRLRVPAGFLRETAENARDAESEGSRAAASAQASYLLHILFVDEVVPGKVVLPIAADEHAFTWPEARGETWEVAPRIGGARFAMSVEVTDLVRGEGGFERLRADGQIRYHDFGTYVSGSHSMTLLAGSPSIVTGAVLGRSPGHVFSLRRPARVELRVIAVLHRVDPGEPLEEVTLATYLDRITPGLARDEAQEAMESSTPLGGVRGLAFAGHVGLGSATLLAAAVLLAQLFRRRSIGFVVTLVAVLLFATAIDRTALDARLDTLGDAAAPVSARISAAKGATETYFFGRTAARGLAETASDSNVPSAVREAARAEARALRWK